MVVIDFEGAKADRDWEKETKIVSWAEGRVGTIVELFVKGSKVAVKGVLEGLSNVGELIVKTGSGKKRIDPFDVDSYN